jgi:iron complex outermembrane receptor protein
MFLASTAVCLVATLPIPVQAQADGHQDGQATHLVAQAGQARHLDIPAKPLPQAIADLSAATGIQVLYTQDEPFGLTSAPVNGTYTAEQALGLMLQGSGLTHRVAGPNAITLVRVPAASGPLMLDPVMVSGSTAAPGSAQDGYRVRDSNLSGFTDQPLIDTPFSVKVIPRELLANQGAPDIGALDRFDASVTSSANNPGWYSNLSVRGFTLDNWRNYRYNGLMMVNQQATALENKESVEILKGLSALQAGFSAPGGIVNYVTKRPAAAPINDVDVAVSQYGNARTAVDISRMTADGVFGLRFNGALEEQRSHVRKVEGDRQFLSIAADWRPTPDTVLRIDVEHERRDQVNQPDLPIDVNGNIPSGFKPRTFLGQTWATYPTRSTLVSVKLEHFLTDRWSVSAEANWMRLERDQNSLDLVDLQPNGDATASLYYSPDQTRQPINLRLMANGQFATGPVGHEVAFGYTGHWHRTRWSDGFYDAIGTTNIYNPAFIPDPNLTVEPSYVTKRVREQGVFVNDVLSFGEFWKLHLGGRYADLDDRSFDSSGAETARYNEGVFSPSVAVVVKPLSNVSTYVSYIEGLEQGGEAPLGTVNQTQQLTPLTSKQVEAGIKAEFGQLTVETALFQIDRPAEYVNAANVYVQDGNQRHRGWEASVTGRLTPEWTLFGSVMLLDAELEETGDPATQGKRPVGVPGHRAALIAEYAPQVLDGWIFSANWTRTGERPVNQDNTTNAPAYDIFGLGARYNTEIGGTPATFRLNVDNILDKRYWSNAQFGTLVAGAPRTVYGSLTLRF